MHRRFALTEGGTLFLDEIGDIRPAVQVKLLRFLQYRTYEPLGGTESLTADVRVVAATHRDRQELTEADPFRRDLLYRINVITVRIPALQEPREDVPLLVDHFIQRFNRQKGRKIRSMGIELPRRTDVPAGKSGAHRVAFLRK